MAGSHGGSRRWRRLRSGEENRGGGECSGERMRTRESEEERQEVRGVADGVEGDERKQEVARGKQEVAEASRARATPRLCSSSWQRRKMTRGRRWAGPARWAWWAAEVSPGKVSLLSAFPIFVVFIYFVLCCFSLVKY